MSALQDLSAALHGHAALIVGVAVAAPAVVVTLLGLFALLTGKTPREPVVANVVEGGLFVSLLAAALSVLASTGTREIDLGPWIYIQGYEVPVVFYVDNVALTFAGLASFLTLLIARFSSTYLHKEIGYFRFFVLLGFFATGTQLIAFAGALDLMFLGWELVGLTSTLFIGFFHERAGPVRASLRAFITYRVCDAGFLLAIVLAHELLGSTKLSAFSTPAAAALSSTALTSLSALFLLAACGKSAQLPFSGWLPRAMEGPTPSSALFYGGVSIHAGLFLLLRVHPVFDLAPVVEGVGVVVGVATAFYATLAARTSTDAKGSLALATLAQVGLILAEISLGLTTLALIHLVGHALLRVFQYLRSPNLIHDAHRTHLGHGDSGASALPRWFAPALYRFRVDAVLDAVADVVVAAASLAMRPLLVAERALPREPLIVAAVVVAAAVAAVGCVVVDVGAFAPAVFVVGAVVALWGGLASIAAPHVRALYRAKVLLHVGFLASAVASGHAGAIVFAAIAAGLAVGGFGFVVDAVERRVGVAPFVQHWGRIAAFPHLAAAFAVIGAAGVGLPGTVGFVADDLLLHAAWSDGVAVTVMVIAASLFMAVGTLRAWQHVFLGPRRTSVASDLVGGERVVVVVVVVVLVVVGLAPGLVLDRL